MAIAFVPVSKNGYDVYRAHARIGQVCKFKSGNVTFKGSSINELEQIIAKMKELQGDREMSEWNEIKSIQTI